jgi:hypothetical protein
MKQFCKSLYYKRFLPRLKDIWDFLRNDRQRLFRQPQHKIVMFKKLNILFILFNNQLIGSFGDKI